MRDYTDGSDGGTSNGLQNTTYAIAITGESADGVISNW